MTSTKDYDKFKMLDCNRESINKKHVGELKTSIIKNGYLASNPIIVNTDFEIIDGQHRFIACRELGLPIFYKQLSCETDLILTLNSTQKKWSANDFANYYAKKGNKDYIRLYNLSKNLGLPITTILVISNGGSLKGGTDKVKRGTLKFSLDEEFTVISTYKKIKLIADGIRQKVSKRMTGALLQLSQKEGFDWETMIQKANKYPTKAYSCISIEDYIIMFRELYNYNSKSKNICKLR